LKVDNPTHSGVIVIFALWEPFAELPLPASDRWLVSLRKYFRAEIRGVAALCRSGAELSTRSPRYARSSEKMTGVFVRAVLVVDPEHHMREASPSVEPGLPARRIRHHSVSRGRMSPPQEFPVSSVQRRTPRFVSTLPVRRDRLPTYVESKFRFDLTLAPPLSTCAAVSTAHSAHINASSGLPAQRHSGL